MPPVQFRKLWRHLEYFRLSTVVNLPMIGVLPKKRDMTEPLREELVFVKQI